MLGAQEVRWECKAAVGAQEVRKLAVGTVNSGKKKNLPLERAGGRHLMRRFLEIFYRLLDGKFQVKFTLPLVDHKSYKKGRID